MYIACEWGSGYNSFLGRIILYLWTCETRNQLFSPKIQWWDILRITILDIPFKKGESARKKDSLSSPKQFLNPVGPASSALGSGSSTLWLVSLGLKFYPLSLRLCPVGHPPFFMKAACIHESYRWVVLSACPLSVEFWSPDSVHFIFFFLLKVLV